MKNQKQKIEEVVNTLDGRKYRPLTVSDLRKALKGLPGDMPVLIVEKIENCVKEIRALDGVFIISDPDEEDED